MFIITIKQLVFFGELPNVEKTQVGGIGKFLR